MSDGIPVVYYGLEQSFSGAGDPVGFLPPIFRNYMLTGPTQMNREPLWPSGYQNTSAYQFVTTLNKVRFGFKPT